MTAPAERFELLSQLGKGGMGTVWKARDTSTGEIIALKLLHEQFADDPYFVERFEREVAVTRRVDSPYVVKMIGYGKRAGRPYLAMEYVEGRSLKEIVQDDGPLAWKDARDLLRQVALGLEAAETAGVVHRDIKPSNILVSGDGTAKLVDFGIAKAADMTALTGTSTTLGTPAYMPPEGKASAQADLYGLGCVAYEMLSGAPPFTGDSQGEVLLKHLREAPDLARLPEDARRVVGWLLQKEPKNRPGSAAALVAVLDGSSKVTRSRTRGGSSVWNLSALAGAIALLLFGVYSLVSALAPRGSLVSVSSADSATEPGASPAKPSKATDVPLITTYQVSSGDTCGGIAYKFSKTIADILVANAAAEAWCESLRRGQTILIPRNGTASKSSWLGAVGSTADGVTLNLDIRKGDLVHMVASGSWCLGQQAADERVCYDANGDVPAPWDTDLVHRTGRVGALIARVGSGPWHSAGSDGTLEFIATADGILELRCNDRESYYADNHGSLRVAIVVGASGG